MATEITAVKVWVVNFTMSGKPFIEGAARRTNRDAESGYWVWFDEELFKLYLRYHVFASEEEAREFVEQHQFG